jgi:hypothetical protein
LGFPCLRGSMHRVCLSSCWAFHAVGAFTHPCAVLCGRVAWSDIPVCAHALTQELVAEEIEQTYLAVMPKKERAEKIAALREAAVLRFAGREGGDAEAANNGGDGADGDSNAVGKAFKVRRRHVLRGGGWVDRPLR